MKTFFDKLFNWIDTRRGAVGGSIVGKLWKKFGYILLTCYTVLLSAFSFVRIFDGDFWGDECYSLRLLTLPFADMIQETALDVHPPLYYIILRIFANVLGMKGWVFHLASFVPYVGILILALTYVYRKMGQWTTLVLVTACSLTKCAVIYNVEVRNYAWAAFFVFSSFLALHSMLEHRTKCNSAWFILASLGAAYTHYYALISVAFFYVVLLLFSLTGDDKKKKIVQTLWVYGITIVGYLPWFVVLLQTFSRTSEGYWMTEYPGFWTCLQYVFLSHFDWEMTIGVICFFVFGLLATGFVFGREREERRVVLYTSVQDMYVFSVRF